MRLNESILKNLKEEYKVGVNKDKVLSAIEDVYRRYCEIAEKYFDKETTQDMYKIINDPSIDSNLTETLKNLVKTDEDGVPLNFNTHSTETTKNGNEYHIFTYFPVCQRAADFGDDSNISLELYPILSFGKDSNADIRKTDGTPAMDRYFNIYGYGYVDYTDMADFPVGDDELNMDIALDFLDKKNEFLENYKRECKTSHDAIKQAVNKRSAEKKKDIADKQREVANIFNKSIE